MKKRIFLISIILFICYTRAQTTIDDCEQLLSLEDKDYLLTTNLGTKKK